MHGSVSYEKSNKKKITKACLENYCEMKAMSEFIGLVGQSAEEKERRRKNIHKKHEIN